MSLYTSPASSTSTSIPTTATATSSSSTIPVTYNPALSAGKGRDEVNRQTPLRSITSSSGFVYPPIWSFPPFFTIQPNPSTLSHQLGLWSTLLLNWARHNRIWEINVDSPDPVEVMINRSINRRLLPPAIRQLITQMVKDGQAIAEPPKQTSRYLIYWRKPEEWGTMIHDWVVDNGMTGSIMTFYEVTDGDMSFTTEFREMPGTMLRKSLDTLVKRGKAQILKGEGEAGDGVRFL